MGQEISAIHFQQADFHRFRHLLTQETAFLEDSCAKCTLSTRNHVGGLEAEAWLVDGDYRPAPDNQRFLAALGDPQIVPELARFNFELNVTPCSLQGDGLKQLHDALADAWDRCRRQAEALGEHALMVGILPTIEEADFSLANMSPLNRYYALNEQVLRARLGKPLVLDVAGHEHLRVEQRDVMLESAATSFQVHWQVAATDVRRYFNAAVALSCATVAAAANSPFLFGRDLWEESRIPLFEQAVEVGGFAGAAQGPVRRVTFGTSYARQSIAELYRENLEHYPVLLPICSDTGPEHLVHLRLHNGTIWRWNRPLVGFDEDGTPHVRIEHRVMAAGPTVVDCMSNAALFYGAAQWLTEQVSGLETRLPFTTAKQNFYAAAQHGLAARVVWLDGEALSVRALILDRLLPAAEHGLAQLGVDAQVAQHYLNVVAARVASGRTGSRWQQEFVTRYGRDFQSLTREYAVRQATEAAVHTWDL